MRYFHSNKNFNQYRPPESFWDKFKKKRQSREVPSIKTQDDFLSNPFKKEKPKQKNYKKIAMAVLVPLIFLGWIALMLALPYFKINNIVINGTKISRPQEVEDYVRYGDYFKDGVICRRNFFLFPDKKVAQKIQNKFLYESVKIEKIFPNTINIIVSEKPASMIYDNNGTIYLLDKDGKMIKKAELSYSARQKTAEISASSTQITALDNSALAVYEQIRANYGNFPVITDFKPIINTDKIISSELINSAEIWQKYLKEQGIGEVKFFTTDETDFNLKITLDKPWYILINGKSEAESQIRNLKMILSENKPTDYIDLRFGDRVYWK